MSDCGMFWNLFMKTGGIGLYLLYKYSEVKPDVHNKEKRKRFVQVVQERMKACIRLMVWSCIARSLGEDDKSVHYTRTRGKVRQ